MLNTGAGLTQRLDELSISAAELAAMVRRPLSDIENWQAAKTIGGEAAVLLRVLADAEDVQRRAAQVRGRRTERLHNHPSIAPFPGTAPRLDGGAPQ